MRILISGLSRMKMDASAQYIKPGTVCGGAETKIPGPDDRGGRRGYSLNRDCGMEE
ncbi:hypothetical protein J6590_007792 [Homalodisca vitripennis]|nr:hypothetical protein J6590_007792 [Homalodisca vitripennis]